MLNTIIFTAFATVEKNRRKRPPYWPLFGTSSWNSFVRVAYGLNDIVGQYEVNDDNAFIDSLPNNALYAETEPKSLRFSIGIGTDFE